MTEKKARVGIDLSEPRVVVYGHGVALMASGETICWIAFDEQREGALCREKAIEIATRLNETLREFGRESASPPAQP